MDAAKSIGPNLRAARKQQGLSQEKLAERIGRPRMYITKLELGTHASLQVDVLVQLCSALNVSAAELVPELAASMPTEARSVKHKKALEKIIEDASRALYAP